MKEFEINKQAQKILNKIILFKKAEKNIEKKLNGHSNQFNDLLSESSELYEKTKIHKYYEEERLKLSINDEESKETDSKINRQKQLLNKKFAQLLSIMNDSKNFSFDSAEEMAKKKLIGFEVALNAVGLNIICHDDTPQNIISGFVVNENLQVPVKPFEFNLNELTESELNYKMWELVKEHSNNITTDFENLKD